MKKHICIISTAVLLGSLLLLGGCNKSPFSHAGELITFGTTSSGTQTRTAYGADFENSGKKYQRIDWEEGDIVRIVSDYARVANDGSNKEYADYTVTDNITPETDGTSAAVVNTNPNGLCWMPNVEKYTFWGVYPSTTTISSAGVVSTDFIKAAQTLPEADAETKTVNGVEYTVYTPSLKNAVMTGIAKDVKENDEKPQVKLHFQAAWTAIEFNLSSQDDDIEITEVQLVADAESDDYLAGPFTMTAGDLGSIAVTTTDASKTVTMAMENVTVKTDKGATFTMFLLPVTNQSTVKLRLTSKDGDNDTKTSVVSLTKNGQTFPFEAGKKYRINGFKAPGSSWKIYISTDILHVDEWLEPDEDTAINLY